MQTEQIDKYTLADGKSVTGGGDSVTLLSPIDSHTS